MISPQIIKQMRLSTCAVIRMPVKHENIISKFKSGDKTKRLDNEVFATAFLVQNGLLLTNRHVVQLITDEHAKTGNHDHWYAEFVHPRVDGNGWTQTIKRIRNTFALTDPLGGGGLDVGLLSFTDAGEMGPCKPVEFGSLDDIVVGNDVAICGYPFGNDSLKNHSVGIFRFGPTVHAGIISAISPYDTVDPRNITTFLTDVSTAGGMSGSPVFLPTNGQVIGIHYSGTVGMIGCAVPLDDRRVQSWICAYEQQLAEGSQVKNLTTTKSGDLQIQICLGKKTGIKTEPV